MIRLSPATLQLGVILLFAAGPESHASPAEASVPDSVSPALIAHKGTATPTTDYEPSPPTLFLPFASTVRDGRSVRPTATPTGDDLYARCVVREETRYLDGVLRNGRTLVFDAQGAVLQEDKDSDGDGRINVRKTWEYARDGRLLEERTDLRANGVAETVVFYTYNRWVWLVRIDFDGLDGKLPDGHSDRVETRVYDAFGDDIRIEVDEDVDGLPDYSTTRVFDPPGQLVDVLIDTDADGVPDHQHTITWRDGLIILREHDRGADGVVDDMVRYDYDLSDRLVREASHYGQDLRFVDEILYTYDGAGRLATKEFFVQSVWHDRVTYQYDTRGRVTRLDYTSNSYPPYVVESDWECRLGDSHLQYPD